MTSCAAERRSEFRTVLKHNTGGACSRSLAHALGAGWLARGSRLRPGLPPARSSRKRRRRPILSLCIASRPKPTISMMSGFGVAGSCRHVTMPWRTEDRPWTSGRPRLALTSLQKIATACLWERTSTISKPGPGLRIWRLGVRIPSGAPRLPYLYSRADFVR